MKRSTKEDFKCRAVSERSGGVVVRALASQKCTLGSISRLSVICGLSLLVLFSALRKKPFTPSIRVEILGVNIQCCSFSKRKMVRSENVLVSIGKFKRKRKNALIKSIAHNFWNVSNGMACTISFSNQNFRVLRVNGKRPGFPLSYIWLNLIFY